MSDTTTTSPPAQAAPSTRQRAATRPTVSVRPVAVGALNAATIAGATAVAAGGGLVLAGIAGGAALAATAAGARKTGHAKANRRETGSVFRRTTTTGGGSTGGGGGRSGRASSGGLGSGSGRSGRSAAGRSSAATPGGRAPGSKPSPFPRGGGATGGRNSAAGRSTPGSSRRGGLLGGIGRSGRNSSTAGGGGHRRAGSTPGSSSRSPLTAAKVAAARRRIANRRQPGPRLSDAMHKATQPGANGKKPTAREAFRNARRAVTGDNPKNRGPVRRAVAGLAAASLAAAKVRRDNKAARKRREAARRRIEARRVAYLAAAQKRAQVARTVRLRTPNTTNPAASASVSNVPAVKPAPITNINPAARPAPVNTGGTPMSRQLLALSEDFLAAAARNQPDGMLQVTAEAHMLPAVLDNLARALKLRYDQALQQPMHPAIKDMYAAIHTNQVAVMSAAEEIGPTIERVHKDELDRLRNPTMRGDESMWDVARNRDAA